MRILLFGKNGQIGSSLSYLYQNNPEYYSYGSKELDITDYSQVHKTINLHNPDLIINATAYTNVDKAESEKELVYRINYKAVKQLASFAKQGNAILMHFSTDYVFDGSSRTPYTENDIPNPINLYGKSKLFGDLSILESGCKFIIIRPGWLYDSTGRGFVQKVVDWLTESDQINVVDDQIGSPTWAMYLARSLFHFIENILFQDEVNGLFNFSCSGETSRYELAKVIAELYFPTEQLKNKMIFPVKSSYFKSAAVRPPYSVLNSDKYFKLTENLQTNWKDCLQEALMRNQK